MAQFALTTPSRSFGQRLLRVLAVVVQKREHIGRAFAESCLYLRN